MLLFNRPVVSDFLQPQNSRPPCPSPSPWVCRSSCSLHPWCWSAVSSSDAQNLSQHQGFSSESSVLIRLPKYWSFSFSISPSSEYSGLISLPLRLAGLISLLSKGLSGAFSSTTVQRCQLFAVCLLCGNDVCHLYIIFIIKELSYWESVTKCLANLIGILKGYLHIYLLHFFKLKDH